MPAVASPNEQVHLDPSLYPRTYTTSAGNRIFLLSLSCIAAGAGLLGTWYFATGHEMKSSRALYIFSLISFLFFLLGVYLAFVTIKYKIVLKTNAIELREIFTTKQLLRTQLAGWRIVPGQYISTLVLVPRDPSAAKIEIGLTIKTDSFFLDWLSAAPNLDETELEQSRSELESNLELGVTREQRSERIATARSVATWLNWIAWIAAVWGWFYPRPYWLVILVLSGLPIVAALIGLRSRGLYQFEGRRNDLRPSLASPVILPGAALAIRALSDLHFLHWQYLIPLAMIVCFAITAIITAADPIIRQRRWPVLTIFFLTVMYGSGVAAQADMFLDRSNPRRFSTEVLKKHVSRGRSTSYMLTISPWGPQSTFTDVEVSARDYNSIQPGQSVCIYLFPGALRIPWYLVRPCPSQPPVE